MSCTDTHRNDHKCLQIAWWGPSAGILMTLHLGMWSCLTWAFWLIKEREGWWSQAWSAGCWPIVVAHCVQVLLDLSLWYQGRHLACQACSRFISRRNEMDWALILSLSPPQKGKGASSGQRPTWWSAAWSILKCQWEQMDVWGLAQSTGRSKFWWQRVPAKQTVDSRVMGNNTGLRLL